MENPPNLTPVPHDDCVLDSLTAPERIIFPWQIIMIFKFKRELHQD